MDDKNISYIVFETEIREMMEEAPDEASKREIQRLAEKMEQM